MAVDAREWQRAEQLIRRLHDETKRLKELVDASRETFKRLRDEHSAGARPKPAPGTPPLIDGQTSRR